MTKHTATSAALSTPPAEQEGALAHGGETLEDCYRRWEGARLAWTETQRDFLEEARRLDEEGDFLLKTLRAARAADPSGILEASREALAVPGAMQRFVSEAEGRLAASRASLEDRERSAREAAERAIDVGRAEVLAALGRYRTHAALRLTLMRRPLAGGRAILHLARPAPDAAMVLAWVLTGKVPTRYGFLFDEATDAPHLAPPSLYAEAGVAPEQVRPDAGSLGTLLTGPSPDLPIRGVIPTQVPRPGAEPALAQWRARGPVLELEWEDGGGGFRTILSTEEASLAAGGLLRLQLEGQLELELKAG